MNRLERVSNGICLLFLDVNGVGVERLVNRFFFIVSGFLCEGF